MIHLGDIQHVTTNAPDFFFPAVPCLRFGLCCGCSDGAGDGMSIFLCGAAYFGRSVTGLTAEMDLVSKDDLM